MRLQGLRGGPGDDRCIGAADCRRRRGGRRSQARDQLARALELLARGPVAGVCIERALVRALGQAQLNVAQVLEYFGYSKKDNNA